jgi:hypothetical protein
VVDGERAVLHSEPDACGNHSSVATRTSEASSLDCVRGVRVIAANLNRLNCGTPTFRHPDVIWLVLPALLPGWHA